MLKNKKVAVFLFLLVICMSLYGYFFDKGKRETPVKKIDVRSIDKDIDLSQIIYSLEDKKYYYDFKRYNYRMAKFVYDINNKRYSEINLHPGYLRFLDFSPSEYFQNKYNEEDTLLYEIVDIKENSQYNKILIDTKLKYDNDDNIYYKRFSIDGDYILDDSFLAIEDIGKKTTYNGIEISIESKAIFSDKEIYKIKFKNNNTERFDIDNDKYGFFAIQDNNKYYHSLINGNIANYRIYPKEEKYLYVCFKNLKGDAKIYMKVQNIEIPII